MMDRKMIFAFCLLFAAYSVMFTMLRYDHIAFVFACLFLPTWIKFLNYDRDKENTVRKEQEKAMVTKWQEEKIQEELSSMPLD